MFVAWVGQTHPEITLTFPKGKEHGKIDTILRD